MTAGSEPKVVSIFGGDHGVAPGSPDPQIIAFLERILARAKAGEIRAIALTYVKPNGRPSEGWHFGAIPDDIFVLHSGAACMVDNLTRTLNSEESTEPAAPPPDPSA